MVKRTLILIIALTLFLGTSGSFGAYEWVLLDGELNIPRHALTGEALTGYVYAIGGIVMPGSPSDARNTVSRYDPATDSWSLVTSVPTARHSLSSAVIDDWIYAVGGHVANSRSENERYNGTSWESRASVYARSSPGVAAYNGELYVFGGNRYATILSRVDIYDPDTDTWRYGCEMPTATQPGRAVTLGDIIYVNNGDDPKELWAYDPVGCTWDTSIPLMNVSRGGYELQAVNGGIYAIGGSNASDGYLSSVESWAPGEGSWTIESSLNVARSQFGSAVIGNDIYIFGGYNGGGLGSTEVLTLSEPPEPIPAIVNIDPDTLKLNSRGKWITCYIELPEGYDESKIEIDSILLETLLMVQHFDVQNGVLMVKFDRQDVIAYIEFILGIVPPDNVNLVVIGEISDGTLFEGSDTIRVK